MERKNLTTYPQMLEGQKGEGWTVVNGGVEALTQRTDLAGRILVVPDGDSVIERNTRIKELASARWTPSTSLGKVAQKEGVDPNCLRCAEDFRLTFNVQRAAAHLFREQFSKGIADPELIDQLVAQLEPDLPQTVSVIPLVMATLGKTEGAARFILGLKAKEYPAGLTGDIKRSALKELIALGLRIEILGQTIMSKHLRKSFAGFPKAIQYAKELMRAQEAAQGVSQACRDEVRNARGNNSKSIDINELKTQKHKIHDLDIVTEFGEMTIKIPPLVMPVKAKNKIARHRVTEEGVLPFQLWRLPIDGKVFLDPRKQKGGSVLVDISGSMGLTPDQVYEFVLRCPGATIGQYSGVYQKGVLLVVAHKGKIAPRHLIGKTLQGNVIDGPALEWLSRMPKPRVWVSDTQVTGIHDGGSQKLRIKCLNFCQKHQIKIVTKFDPDAVTRALHTSHRRLLAAVRKDKAYA